MNYVVIVNGTAICKFRTIEEACNYANKVNPTREIIIKEVLAQ